MTDSDLIGGPELLEIKRALISVSDKTGIVELAGALVERGVEIVSTGGTSKTLVEAGIAVTDVSAVTGMPEMMDGRVKTLHPGIHGGLLALRDQVEHVAAMREHGIQGIDCLVSTLYPFEATVAGGADAATAIENIDIGGPAMIRAAAKNAAWVAVLTDSADYGALLLALKEGGVSRGLRARLAAKAFARTASYDAAIASWYAAQHDDAFPSRLVVSATLRERLRYGENPHQPAALYLTSEPGPSIARARQVQGKPLSYNNIADADAAFELVSDLGADVPAIAIIKHANPCGAASGADLAEAYALALRCDPVSAYGGIVAANLPLDARAAEAITGIFTEVVVAPEADEEAIRIFAGKPNLRLLLTGGLADSASPHLRLKSVAGGLLAQESDFAAVSRAELSVVTRRAPSEREFSDLVFAFRVAKHVKSNAIVYVKDGATAGIGAGQMSRIDSARIAAIKAAEAAVVAGLAEPLTRGSVVASDAFFPFADGLIAAAEAGATAVIQPGGSLRDGEVIAAADQRGLAMVFTDVRHFRHLMRAILFDKDGTLLDFQASWSRVFRELAHELCEGDIARADVMLAGGGMDPVSGHVRGGSMLAAGNAADIVALWFPALAGAELVAMVKRFDATFHANGVAFSVPLPEVAETLAALSRSGMTMGVATSDGTEGSKAALAAIGLAQYLPHVFGYDFVARPKPAPDIVYAFAAASGVMPAEIAMVGDNTHDMEMARAANVGAAIGVLSGNGTREQLEPLADVVLESVCDLPGWLEKRR